MGPGRCDVYAHCVVFMIGCILPVVAVDIGREACVIDLIAELNTTSTSDTKSVTIHPSLSSRSPILELSDSTRYLRLPDSVATRTVACLRDSREFTVLAAVKQDLSDTGSIVSLSADLLRFLEVESSGRRNEIRVHYSSSGETVVELFPYSLADSRWHQLAVTLGDAFITIHVDCQRIYRRVVKPIDRTFGDPSSLSLFIGQRNRRHALFRGALQDVKIVTQNRGHLLQCPESEAARCVNCSRYEVLAERFDEMLYLYRNMSAKLDNVQQRLAAREMCDCQKNCHYNGSLVTEGHMWQVNCSTCSCQNGSVQCSRVSCPPAQCKHPVYVKDTACCPTCLSQCFMHGEFYDHGESFSPRVCVTCVCNDGNMACEEVDPHQTCPTLDCSEDKQLSVQGECCPVCQGTDFCSKGHDCHENATCVNLATRYACQCLSGFHGDGRECTDVDECSSDGGQHGHHCPTEMTCVNTVGSYHCVCPDGHRSLDNYTCQGSAALAIRLYTSLLYLCLPAVFLVR